MSAIDNLIERSLKELAQDGHLTSWYGKERDWVNYFTHRHLMPQCSSSSPVKDWAQICIEVSVPQPPGYNKPSVCRDIVIWHTPGDTCFTPDGRPNQHPLALIEWKVHRQGRRNPDVSHERQWLRAYCGWQPAVFGYAVEVEIGVRAATLTCCSFLAGNERVLCAFEIPRVPSAEMGLA